MSGYERNISDEFLNSLESGVLEPLLMRVRKDDFLNLEFRGGEIIIYHRGGMLLKASENGISQPQDYSVILNNDYLSEEIEEIEVGSRDDLEEVFDYLPRLKDSMERHFDDKNRYELAYSQQIIRMNNYPEVLKGTDVNNSDYFIIDFEPVLRSEDESGDKDEADLLGVKWPSTNRRENKNLTPAIFELKFRKLNSDDESSSLKGHLNRVQKLADKGKLDYIFDKDEEVSEAIKIFNNKRRLNLIDSSKDIVSFDTSEIEYIICLFDFTRKSMEGVIERIIKLERELMPEKISIKIALAGLMGAALKEYNVLPPEKVLKMFEAISEMDQS